MSGANGMALSASVISQGDNCAPPLLAAVFLIKFDLKVGYTITWKRSVSDVELEGTVEFKSLPSGLHAVKDDLVYFIQDQYAGLSAFVNGPASEAERNAHLVAVGILVPLSYGRLGRSWLHAQKLQQLASWVNLSSEALNLVAHNITRALVDDTSKTAPLEEFWELYRLDKHEIERADGGPSNGRSEQRPSFAVSTGPKGHSRARALSSLTNVLPSDQLLPPFHPALSILQYIDTFGPLIFPLHRAALLRKRILLMTSPPVRLSCEYVFDLSILSSIPASIAELLSPDTESLHRLRSFFAIGIHDIPLLEQEAALAKAASTGETLEDASANAAGGIGWVACSTDEILAHKEKLYDILIEMPPNQDDDAPKKTWPKIKTSHGDEVKATQRDLRRWKILHRELHKMQNDPYPQYRDDDSDEEDDEDTNALLQRSFTSVADDSPEHSDYDDRLVEAMSWSQLAYNGFMWWASAGEKDASVGEEAERDRQVLGDLSDFVPLSPRTPRSSRGSHLSAGDTSLNTPDAAVQTAIIAYFHRLTSVIVSTLAEIVDSADDEEPENEREHESEGPKPVVVGSDEIGRMGLDEWSEADRVFAREMLRIYFGREAVVRGAGIDCCGLRIC